MGCRILEDPDNGAVFYCSTTGVAFGPVMSNREEADLFITVLIRDPRSYSDSELMNNYSDFVHNYVCECGSLRDEFDAEMRAEMAVPQGCSCDRVGDCQWCTVKAEAYQPNPVERFRCYQCVRSDLRKQARQKVGTR